MGEYVNKIDVLNLFDEVAIEEGFHSKRFVEGIIKMPEANVEEITYCKDCKYSDVLEPATKNFRLMFCKRAQSSLIKCNLMVNDFDYCNHGEPKDESIH